MHSRAPKPAEPCIPFESNAEVLFVKSTCPLTGGASLCLSTSAVD